MSDLRRERKSNVSCFQRRKTRVGGREMDTEFSEWYTLSGNRKKKEGGTSRVSKEYIQVKKRETRDEVLDDFTPGLYYYCQELGWEMIVVLQQDRKEGEKETRDQPTSLSKREMKERLLERDSGIKLLALLHPLVVSCLTEFVVSYLSCVLLYLSLELSTEGNLSCQRLSL